MIGSLSNVSDDDSEVTQDDLIDESVIKMMKKQEENKSSISDDLFPLKNANFDQLITKLKKSQIGDLDSDKIQSILKKIPKLNSRLESAFESLNSNSLSANEAVTSSSTKQAETAKLLREIDEKWQSYLSADKLSKGPFIESISIKSENKFINSATTPYYINGDWANSTAYHKLSFDSGSSKLNEKWNTYIGNKIRPIDRAQSNQSIKPAMTSFGTSTIQPSSNLFSNSPSNLKITLPASTIHRLNQHKEWLKKFKAQSFNLSIDHDSK